MIKRPEDTERVIEHVSKYLCQLLYFPSEELAHYGIAEKLAGICNSLEEVQKLCVAFIEEYDEWPGPASFHNYCLEWRQRSEPASDEKPERAHSQSRTPK